MKLCNTIRGTALPLDIIVKGCLSDHKATEALAMAAYTGTSDNKTAAVDEAS